MSAVALVRLVKSVLHLRAFLVCPVRGESGMFATHLPDPDGPSLSAVEKMSQPRIIAVIPARGGSVTIPKKNIKLLAGRPLIDWVIQPAIDSKIFAEVRLARPIFRCRFVRNAMLWNAGVGVHRRR